MSSFDATIPTVEEIHDMLMDSAMNSSFEVTAEGVQTVIQTKSWRQFFEDVIKADPWHYSATKTTPHKESLYDHLIETGKLSYEEAKRLQYDKKDIVKSYLCGVLHDIGKPGCRMESSVHYSFKGHGLVGGALIEMYVSDNLLKNFATYGLTRDDFADISLCSDCHMCGYFENRGKFDCRFHRACFKILPISTRKTLCTLRVGDQIGRVPLISNDNGPFSMTIDEIKGAVMNTQDQFVADLMSPSSTIDLFSLLKENRLTNGVLIRLQGTSSVGKTTLAKKLSQYLESLDVKTRIISRDNFMVKWSRYYQKLEPIADEDVTPSVYQQAIDYYTSTEKYFRDSIDKDMKNTITDGLFAGEVVFVDTLMMAHPQSAKTVLSDACKRAFRLDLWIHRADMITEEETSSRHGIDLNKQITLHGKRSAINPFSPKTSWKALTPITELTDLEHFDICKPHMAISCGWTGLKDSCVEYIMFEIKKIYDFNQSIPRFMGLHHTFDMHLDQLIFFLYKQGGMDVVFEFFDYYAYRTPTPTKQQNIIGVKYVDGINQVWAPVWAREARGRFYYISDEEVLPLKDGLQRGVEILTKAHMEDGVNETQDISDQKLDRFDKRQQKTLKTFTGDNKINGYLTGKVDGSLLEFNVYPNTCKQHPVMVKFLEDKRDDDPFTCVLLDYCVDNNLPLISVSTQGTLVIGDQMRDYFLTSIEPYVEYELNNNLSDLENWQFMCPLFVNFVLAQMAHFPDPKNSPMFIKYEAICKNRTTYRGTTHIELAVGYAFSGISLLGIMLDNRYIPHYEVMSSKEVVPHPVSCHVSSTVQVFQIMRELNNVVMSKMNLEDFMMKWFPDQVDYPIHAEGFVYLDADEENDYSKIKLPIYYTTHKVKSNEVQTLLSLPSSVEAYFPVITRLRDFYDNLEPKLVDILNTLMIYVSADLQVEDTETSVFYSKLNTKAKTHVDRYRDNLDDAKLKTLVFKIVVNVCKAQLYEKIDIETKRVWDVEGENQRVFMHRALMTVQPWSCDESSGAIREKVHEALKSSDLVNAAYAAIVNIGENSMVCL